MTHHTTTRIGTTTTHHMNVSYMTNGNESGKICTAAPTDRHLFGMADAVFEMVHAVVPWYKDDSLDKATNSMATTDTASERAEIFDHASIDSSIVISRHLAQAQAQ